MREASRAVLFDEHNLVPLLYVSKFRFHMLPGGGIDMGEDKIQALIREVKEETGADINVMGEIGKIIEFRAKVNLKQISYCYLGKITSKGTQKFTEEELSEGFKLVWLSLDEAISTVEHDKPNDYEGPFIQKRDLTFLRKAQQILHRKKTVISWLCLNDHAV
ncbi:MAG: NUDIX domain-containing protein [Candidatus Aenigmarchaeota archaeon]|nr:NUDIX domain-containing protein [Candidatus Aenigmarchaeota archaeon]